MQINKQISNKQIKLIVGLGNPSDQYKNTRHNIGFIVVDRLAQSDSAKLKIEKKFQAEVGFLPSTILLIKPQTYMNLSGEAVAKIANFYKIDPKNIIIIHDDVDLELGRLKIQKGGGTAGHHGLESIVKSLGTSDFIRFRVGIGKPLAFNSKQLTRLAARQAFNKNIENYVLEKFSEDEWEIINKAIARTVEAIEYYLNNDLEKTMNKYN